MKALCILVTSIHLTVALHAANPWNWPSHDRTRPAPDVVTPGKVSTEKHVGTAPSDAIVLFDGTDLSKWSSMNGEPTKWIIKDGVMECLPRSGYIRTLQSFGDCQFHVEWSAPKKVEGNGQGRGNSGVFFGLDKYEIQVLDSYENKTYSDGSAGSIYGQYPPLVNACKKPGEWQTYDIIYTAPRFSSCGELKAPAKVTVLHNGILIQNNSKYTGPTAWIGRPPYEKHPTKMPIAFQDHGNPVRYRNIWVRELGKKSKPEFMLPDSILDKYTGKYDRDHGGMIEVKKLDYGMLGMKLAGQDLEFSAESETQFFCKTTDVLLKFEIKDGKKLMKISVGDGWMTAKSID